MTIRNRNQLWRPRHTGSPLSRALLALSILIPPALLGCGASPTDLEVVQYTPLPGGDWQVSTPEAQGLDPKLVDRLYRKAAGMSSVYGLLVFKNDALIAEAYFNGASVDQTLNIHSVTKSYNSALVGIALEQGCLSGVDQKMMDFFPEFADRIRDPRKAEITIRDLLQMRAGYPWEESGPELLELLFTGFHTSNVVDVPLAYDPGTSMQYSNLSSHLLGIIVSRACGTDLKSFAEQYLLGPLGTEVAFWQTDWDGNYLGFSDLHVGARDLAKFGLTYLNDGQYQGVQLVPSDWVHDSLQVYSEDAWSYRVGRHWKDVGYGYQWWSVRAGSHRYNLAWGHGGEQIALLKDLDMVVVATVDPLHLQHGDKPWRIEKANLNMVADFIASLPNE